MCNGGRRFSSKNFKEETELGEKHTDCGGRSLAGPEPVVSASHVSTSSESTSDRLFANNRRGLKLFSKLGTAPSLRPLPRFTVIVAAVFGSLLIDIEAGESVEWLFIFVGADVLESCKSLSSTSEAVFASHFNLELSGFSSHFFFKLFASRSTFTLDANVFCRQSFTDDCEIFTGGGLTFVESCAFELVDSNFDEGMSLTFCTIELALASLSSADSGFVFVGFVSLKAELPFVGLSFASIDCFAFSLELDIVCGGSEIISESALSDTFGVASATLGSSLFGTLEQGLAFGIKLALDFLQRPKDLGASILTSALCTYVILVTILPIGRLDLADSAPVLYEVDILCAAELIFEEQEAFKFNSSCDNSIDDFSVIDCDIFDREAIKSTAEKVSFILGSLTISTEADFVNGTSVSISLFIELTATFVNLRIKRFDSPGFDEIEGDELVLAFGIISLHFTSVDGSSFNGPTVDSAITFEAQKIRASAVLHMYFVAVNMIRFVVDVANSNFCLHLPSKRTLASTKMTSASTKMPLA
uniref:Uncharacterized protein n=1 Tax=Glossina pallidipes TaxID=7398 RepID=A0A1A9ZRY0_GLOPL